MDLGPSIMGLILLVICSIPFLLIGRARVKKNKKLLQSLQDNAQQHHCKISKHEFCGDFLIGMDEQKNNILFLKYKKEAAVIQFVDLSAIQTCQIHKKFRNNGAESSPVPEHLELCFTPKDKNKAEISFELYDEYTNLQLSGELQLIEKWSNDINDRLKTKP